MSANPEARGKSSGSAFAPDVQANLTPYVVQQALDGMFLMLAREEAAIRQDPAARTTELLQTVFGS
jgi:hypothetical protein